MAALLDRLYNLHWVAKGVARSAQPYLGFYAAFLRPHGFRAIINLRGHNPGYGWWRKEAEAAKRLNIEHIDVRMSSRLLPAREALIDLLEALQSAPRPVLIKCSGGQDRAGFAAAIYRLAAGETRARAEAELRFWPYLHIPKRYQRWMRRFPEYAMQSAGTADFEQWIRERYTPEDFAEWLRARGEGANFRALQIYRDGPGKNETTKT